MFATETTPAQNVATNQCIAALQSAVKRRKACERPLKTNRKRLDTSHGVRVLVLVASVLLEGCASITSSGRSQQVLVCPQCKMVKTVAWLPAGPSFSRAGVSAYGVNGLYPSPTITKHSCPGCQGTLTTFTREGKWEHKCSICAQRPFTCPMVHPD